ncbi:MAG TPA: type II toxin-antitoxin system RelE/ParE family toxin [Thermoanaerobaculia bacterium]|nr:type II toxin-antitoxin system RelE/ParE family toxin [Thermoanaerobaculia bacterium]
MSRFVLTPAAREDLVEIYDYISKDSPNAARRVLAELRSAMSKLARMPELGHFRRDLASEPFRFWSVYSYLVIYRSEARPIQVLRVLHGARDVRAILEEGS